MALKNRVAYYKHKFGIKGKLKPGDLINRSRDGYKRVITKKKAGWLGDTDVNKKIIRIHKKAHLKNKKKERGRLINTIYHEEIHAKHPKMTEKEVYHKTRAEVVKKLSAEFKRKLYSKYHK